ncbi:hypothetical protein OIU14_05335 [Thalassobacter stenotrophicus]|uniref:hypothetical protein n=1 Tax=Thalassobacter stenotrophicus TaxID=266809 RepID=UPI0022A8F2A1|nr:hypothetical protein [Thalassobacter stenotrophicus]UYP69155.1 hypothetical protein OIU14_05335 [Thalassobacter stenotrophicus]
MKYSTDTRVRREVERAVEGVLDRWATGNVAKDVESYITKLRLTAAHLRSEAQAIDELADQEARESGSL